MSVMPEETITLPSVCTDTIAPAQRFHLTAILALVEEEAGLLPAQTVGLEAQAAFEKCNRSAGPCRAEASERRLVRHGAFGKNNFAIAPCQRPALHVAAQTENDAFARDIFLEQRERVVQSRQPRRRVKFQHQRRVVAIQHEAGPAVAFAVDEAVAGGLRVEKVASAGEGLLQPCLPPRAINCLRFARSEEHTSELQSLRHLVC